MLSSSGFPHLFPNALAPTASWDKIEQRLTPCKEQSFDMAPCDAWDALQYRISQCWQEFGKFLGVNPKDIQAKYASDPCYGVIVDLHKRRVSIALVIDAIQKIQKQQ